MCVTGLTSGIRLFSLIDLYCNRLLFGIRLVNLFFNQFGWVLKSEKYILELLVFGISILWI